MIRLVFLVEGETDFQILRFLVQRIVQEDVECIRRQRRFGGLGDVFASVVGCVWQAYQWRASGAVIDADADRSTPHASHVGKPPGDCRYCAIAELVPVVPEPRPKVCIGVPVEAIEAWLLEWGDLIGIKRPRDVERLPRRRGKELLWGSATPRREDVTVVCEKLFPLVAPEHIERLAESQESFRTFRASLQSLS